jgi:hypothetical protein
MVLRQRSGLSSEHWVLKSYQVEQEADEKGNKEGKNNFLVSIVYMDTGVGSLRTTRTTRGRLGQGYLLSWPYEGGCQKGECEVHF